mmetsp:Transcript_22210/g.52579  ORF Transcript_22210/g.52579 Transcript_22210/m.52579 type:complete len:134 (-) Transcript_22210:956-1357(-)
MFLIDRKKKGKKFLIQPSFYLLTCFEKKIAFQVFLDLCLSRKWNSVKIFAPKFQSEYRILAQNPQNREVEIFFPIFLETGIKLNKPKAFLELCCQLSNKKIFNVVNIAFVDPDSTIAYYRVNFVLHRASGPFL